MRSLVNIAGMVTDGRRLIRESERTVMCSVRHVKSSVTNSSGMAQSNVVCAVKSSQPRALTLRIILVRFVSIVRRPQKDVFGIKTWLKFLSAGGGIESKAVKWRQGGVDEQKRDDQRDII